MPLVERIYEGLDEIGRPHSEFDICVRVEAAVSDDEEMGCNSQLRVPEVCKRTTRSTGSVIVLRY